MCLFCQLWSCWVPIGVGMVTLITKHTLQPVCLEMPPCMPRSIHIDHTHLNTKMCCMCVGGSLLLDLVISGTDWCWYANTDKELHLSSY